MRHARLGWALLLVFAVLYGVVDVRNRARVDRGPKYHRTDFTVYQAAARALRDGTNPYEARNPRGHLYLYPPLLAILLMPVARWEPTAAALLFYAVSFLALVLTVRALMRLARPDDPRRATGAAALALLLSLPFLHESFERGQVTILLVAIQVAALVLLRRRRHAAAGATLALAGAIRLTPLLAAGAVALGTFAACRRVGWGPVLRFAGGVAAGLLLAFVVLPVAVLGPGGARKVTRQWLEASRAMYGAAPGELEDLEASQGIDEYRYKNQAPRRVLATWTGWLAGVPFDDERPALSPAQARGVDVAAYAVAAALALLAAWLGWRRLRDPAGPDYLVVFAFVTVLPLFMTRYTWPTHYVAVLPAALLLAARPPPARRTWALVALAAGTIAFYVAHARPLEVVGAAGCLLLGAAVFVARGVVRPGRAGSGEAPV